MELKLNRRYRGSTYTIGALYINGEYFCDTIEDVDRGLNASMNTTTIASKKVYGSTAIPKGVYPVNMGTISSKFVNKSWAKRWGGKLPRLVNVKGFDGVLIHVGNTAEDSLGCILVGENKVKGQVINSITTFDRLMSKMVEAYYRGENIIITIL